ncbi:Glycosyl transferase family 2 [Methanobrevibacter gottschalkii]|uniref:Glycosyl transferase family 2 n=1 Tax=Methanobrevibacter gottschalkii TaxID=190974 RepID=A0A1H7NFL2_9EURY|nr:glycosyltransferase [Methanobrevibacter gottschalkii]SEL22121.1 Glycosyl transferase family 2 [Methanobrevibacter gottschalkii]
MIKLSNYEYKLSVVVLVYNTEIYLRDCLDSLVNQTLNDIEIICVNDESTDNSLNILNKYAKKYDNLKIINQKNQGGAIAGNNGLKIAKGEYVAIIDSDDIVVHDAYEKLYKKAKETDSDIVSGKPNIYMGYYQREVTHKNNIWDNEKTFKIDETLDIFYDVFYWNKIYKRSLITNHDIYMIPGKIYADVPLVFRAYLFANKISIIPDVVYLWRKRETEAIIKGNVETSVSKSLLDIDNMKDRLSTYYYLKDYFKEAEKEQYFNNVIKTYLERFFYPINGILKDKHYENAYLNEIRKITEDIDDIYNNDLKLRYNLFIYFIKNHLKEELKDFINFDLMEKDTITKDKEVYWNLKYFNNPKYNISNELFKVKKVEDIFIDVENINSDSEYIYVKNVKLPKNVPIKKVQICFMGLTKKYSKKHLNNYRFDLMEDPTEINLFNGKIKISDIHNINSFDVNLAVIYEDNKEELFRLKEINFPIDFNKEHWEYNEKLTFNFSKLGNLSMKNNYCENIFKIETNEESMKIIPLDEGDINYKIFIEYKQKADKVNFLINKDEFGVPLNELELKWKYSLDKHKEYKFYIQLGTAKLSLKTKYIKKFKDIQITSEIGEILLTNNKNDDILIKLK